MAENLELVYIISELRLVAVHVILNISGNYVRRKINQEACHTGESKRAKVWMGGELSSASPVSMLQGSQCIYEKLCATRNLVWKLKYQVTT